LSETTLATAKGGGWPRLNRLFGGELEQVLHRFHEAVWEAA
jgi:type I restriction enzyme R subunit